VKKEVQRSMSGSKKLPKTVHYASRWQGKRVKKERTMDSLATVGGWEREQKEKRIWAVAEGKQKQKSPRGKLQPTHFVVQKTKTEKMQSKNAWRKFCHGGIKNLKNAKDRKEKGRTTKQSMEPGGNQKEKGSKWGGGAGGPLREKTTQKKAKKKQESPVMSGTREPNPEKSQKGR